MKNRELARQRKCGRRSPIGRTHYSDRDAAAHGDALRPTAQDEEEHPRYGHRRPQPWGGARVSNSATSPAFIVLSWSADMSRSIAGEALEPIVASWLRGCGAARYGGKMTTIPRVSTSWLAMR